MKLYNALQALTLALVMSGVSLADTPPPGAVKIKGGTDGTNIGNTGDALKVTATFTPSGTQNVNVTNASIAVTGPLTDTQLRASAVPVSAASLPLPSGASTSALQSSTISTLGSPFQAGGSIGNTSFGISGTLPAYASTPTFNIGTTNGLALDTTLSSFSAKFGTLGQKTMAGSAPVVIASDQSALAVTGPLTDTQLRASAVPVSISGSVPVTGTVAVSNFPATQAISAASLPLPTGAATSALQTTGNSSVASIDAKLNSLGQKTMANSAPVVLSSDQSAIPVTGTFFQATQPVSAASLPLPSGASTAAKQPALGTAGAASADVITVQGIAGMTALKVDGSAVTQPVSAASLPLPALAATSTKQSDGSQKTQLVDGSGNVVGPVTTLSGTNYAPVVLAASATPGAALSARSVQIAGSDGTNAQTISTDSSGRVRAPVNVTGSGSAAAATVSTVATLTAPANAVGFVLMNLDVSTTNMRWAVGRTASTTLGQQLQPGRDTGFVPIGANISIIAESGTVTYDVQWVSQ